MNYQIFLNQNFPELNLYSQNIKSISDDFFREINVEINFPIFFVFLNSPSMIFEMFPFIFLIAAQLFFIKLFDNKEIEILKYSGLKNSKIIIFLCMISLICGLFVSLVFYNFSSNLKNIYLELKSNYTNDGKYLGKTIFWREIYSDY